MRCPTAAERRGRCAYRAGAGSSSPEASQVYASLQKANRLQELERVITEDKVFEFLLKQSTIEEVKS